MNSHRKSAVLTVQTGKRRNKQPVETIQRLRCTSKFKSSRLQRNKYDSTSTKFPRTLQPPVQCGLKVYPVRLIPDMEIKSVLLSYVKCVKLKAAFILTCCGSVKKATLRYATAADGTEQVETLEKCFEITSLVGTLCTDGAHLHVTLGGTDGSTVSGHVMGDLIVQTTAEIVLGEAHGVCFSRVDDPATGWPELVVSRDSSVSSS